MATATATKSAAPALAATPTDADALSFSELTPGKAQKSVYPHIKTLDGQRVVIKDVATEDAGKTYYAILADERRMSVPKTLAKKLSDALKAATEALKSGKGNGRVGVTVKALERGVRVS